MGNISIYLPDHMEEWVKNNIKNISGYVQDKVTEEKKNIQLKEVAIERNKKIEAIQVGVIIAVPMTFLLIYLSSVYKVTIAFLPFLFYLVVFLLSSGATLMIKKNNKEEK